MSIAFAPEVIPIPGPGHAELGRRYAASGRPVYVQRNGLASTRLKYSMKSRIAWFSSSTDVNDARFSARRARMPNHDLRELLRRELRRRAAPRLICEHLADKGLQRIIVHRLRLCELELRARRDPPVPPPPSPLRIKPHLLRQLDRGSPCGGAEDEPHPLRQPRRQRPRTREPLEDRPLAGRERS